MEWRGVVWCGVVWCGVVWCCVVLCGVVWCGVVWYVVCVWCGVVWCGEALLVYRFANLFLMREPSVWFRRSTRLAKLLSIYVSGEWWVECRWVE